MKVDHRVEAVLSIVHRHYIDSTLSLSQISKALGLSTGHLGRLFTAGTGVAFRDYLRQVRMNKAVELLKNSDHNAKTISALVGYSRQSHFGRDFVAHAGMPPKQFRNSHLLQRFPPGKDYQVTPIDEKKADL